MSDSNQTLKILSDQRKLRAFVRSEMNLTELDAVIKKMTAIREEVAEEERRIQAESEERESKLAEYAAMIKEDGISIDDVIAAMANTSVRPKKVREKKEPKYQYQKDNETKLWTGQGRTPSPIQTVIDNGGCLEDFLIKKD